MKPFSNTGTEIEKGKRLEICSSYKHQSVTSNVQLHCINEANEVTKYLIILKASILHSILNWNRQITRSDSYESVHGDPPVRWELK